MGTYISLHFFDSKPRGPAYFGIKPPGTETSGFCIFVCAKVPTKQTEVSMSLTDKIRGFYISCQHELFPWLERELGSFPERYKKLVLEMACVEDHLPRKLDRRCGGRPQVQRTALARSFLAKMVLNISTTSALRERLKLEPTLRSICGWSCEKDVPSASTFSRAFQEFATMQLPNRIHAALIRDAYADELVGHISRDSTAIEAREKPVPKNQESTSEDVKAPPKKRKRGRPKKGEERPKAPRRLEQQLDMDLEEILDELPKDCTVGCKRNAKGYTNTWAGFTLHMDSADGGIPISCVVTSASLHDSQVAIALARMTGQRVQYCYELMDSAYDAKDVYEQSRSSGHVAMIDPNPRKKKAEHVRECKARRNAGFVPAERVRYRQRTTVERAFGRLKDEFGARNIRVKGHLKVTCHLMFGVVVLTVDQLLRLVQ